MDFKKIGLAVVVSAAMLSGCSTTPDIADRIEEADELEQEMIKRKNARLQERIDDLPDWVITAPPPDGSGVYAVGIGDSTDLSIAVKKAQLEAEFGLAKVFRQELSGSERMYSTDNGSYGNNQFEGLIDKLVQQVPVVGFTVVDKEIRAENGKYSVYVLLKLPYDQFNTVLQQSKARESRREMKQAFEDLERRLEKRRQQDDQASATEQDQYE